MTEKTEKKIMDTALRIFASKGYQGATTRFIASESGFSEVTLFRKFETKDNLFKAILKANQQKIIGELNSVFSINEFKNSTEFLETLIKGIVAIIDENFDFVNILMNEKCQISENALKLLVNKLGEYVEEKFPGKKIDYSVFAFTIVSFAYFVIFDKTHGRTFIDHNKAIDEFINQSAILLE